MKQLRGGNSVGYIRNGVLFSDSSSGCLRRIFLRANGVEETNHDKRTLNVFALGHYSEELFEETYLKGKFEYDKEKKVVVPLSDLVEFAGSSDYVVKDCVYELKSCTSSNTYKKVFKDGNWKQDNLVQLVNYMIALEIPVGKLCYTSFCDKMDYKDLAKYSEEEVLELARQSKKETKVFNVTITEEGKICVENVVVPLTVKDIMTFQEVAADVLGNQKVYLDRPSQEEASFFSPCGYCPASSVCDSFEYNRFDSVEFINRCKEVFKPKEN